MNIQSWLFFGVENYSGENECWPARSFHIIPFPSSSLANSVQLFHSKILFWSVFSNKVEHFPYLKKNPDMMLSGILTKWIFSFIKKRGLLIYVPFPLPFCDHHSTPLASSLSLSTTWVPVFTLFASSYALSFRVLLN